MALVGVMNFILFVGIITALVESDGACKSNKPNVVIIIADDLVSTFKYFVSAFVFMYISAYTYFLPNRTCLG